jgi:hypothetical protein
MNRQRTAIAFSGRAPLDAHLSPASILRNLALISALFFLNKFGLPGNAAFLAALVFMTLQSAESAVKALSLLFLVVVGNTALVNTGSPLFSIGKFLMIFFVCWRLLQSQNFSKQSLLAGPVMKPLILFCFVSLLLAVEGGYFVLISTLKLVSFLVGSVCIFVAAKAMSGRPHRLDAWFFSVVLFIALLGVATFVAGIGYNQINEYGSYAPFFNGPFYHSMTLGPAAAMIVIWLFGFAYLSQYRNRVRIIALSLIPLYVLYIYLSSSRTSLLAIGFAFVALVFASASARSALRVLAGKIMRPAVLAIAVLTLSLAAYEFSTPGVVSRPLTQFIAKGQSAKDQVEIDDVLYSRQSLLEMMLVNIENDPWTGIGFGTSTHDGFGSDGSIFRAPTEKGILPIAVVEETGVVGALFFANFVVATFVFLLRSSNITGLMGFAGLIGINMTEMNFFSFGGHGGFFWLWFMACMILMPYTPPDKRGSLQKVQHRRTAVDRQNLG